MMRKDKLEHTLVLIKPDALKNSMTGYVFSQLSEFHSGMRFAGMKIVRVNRMLAEEHYVEHRGKPFYPSLIEYLTGAAHYPEQDWKRRVIALVYQGPNAIQCVRTISGPTNPHEARETFPGSIRSLGTVVPIMDKRGRKLSERVDNLIHASASSKEAEREIKLWFKPNDIPPGMRFFKTKICEDHCYYLKGRIYKDHEKDSICILAPGDAVWSTDLEIVNQVFAGKRPMDQTINPVVAKYLINEDRGE